MDDRRAEEDRERRIREIAHRIWEDEGRPPGQEQRHWEMAEREFVAEQQDQPARAAPHHPDEAVTEARSESPNQGQTAAPKPRARTRTAAAAAKTSRKPKREGS